MWMSYVDEIEITNVQSGIQRLQQEFCNFDAKHEVIHGRDKQDGRYDRGGDISTNYLEGNLTIHMSRNWMR